MTRRRRRLAWTALLLGVTAGGAALLIQLNRPASPPTEPDEGAIPEAWFSPSLEEPSPVKEVPPDAMDADDPLPPTVKAGPPVSLPLGYVQRGKLAYELDGRRVAEETYRFERLPSGEVSLVSSGTFSVRVLLVTVSVAFDQEIVLDEELWPRSYRLETRGPLGLGSQRITVTVDGDRALATSGDDPQEIQMPQENAFFVGTLAAYAVIPSLYATRVGVDVLQLEAVGGGAGPPGGSRGGSAAGGAVEVSRQGSVEVEVGGRALVFDQYHVQAGSFGGTLLARDSEFVAFVGEGERTFTAYRSDLFPRGISLGRTP